MMDPLTSTCEPRCVNTGQRQNAQWLEPTWLPSLAFCLRCKSDLACPLLPFFSMSTASAATSLKSRACPRAQLLVRLSPLHGCEPSVLTSCLLVRMPSCSAFTFFSVMALHPCCSRAGGCLRSRQFSTGLLGGTVSDGVFFSFRACVVPAARTTDVTSSRRSRTPIARSFVASLRLLQAPPFVEGSLPRMRLACSPGRRLDVVSRAT